MKGISKRYSLFLLTATLICLMLSFLVQEVNSDLLPDPPLNLHIADADPNNGYKQWNTHIAASSTSYLCVWDNGIDILGRFIDLDGESQGELINITSEFDSGSQIEPDLATDGGKYLVVWSDRRDLAETDYDIYGCFVYMNGTTSGAFQIDTSEGRQRFPKVEFNGQHYLVIWEDWAEYDLDTHQLELKYKRLSSNGNLLDTEPTKIAVAVNKYARKACFDLCLLEESDKPDISWFITWNGFLNTEQYEILGGFLKDNGNELLLNQQIQIITPLLNRYYIYHSNPSVANIDDILLVVWESWRDELGDTDIYGRRIEAEKMDSECIQISAKEEQERYPEAASNGQVFFVMWKDLENIYGRRISKEGFLLNDHPPASDSILISEADPNYTKNIYHLAAASNGLEDDNQFLCVWSDNKTISDNPFIQTWFVKGYSYSPPPPPELIWLGLGNYTDDGANPDSGPGGSEFTFKVKYLSSLSLAPSTAQIWIDLDDNGIYDRMEKFTMTAETDGITYTYSKNKIHYDGDGILAYKFFFSNDYNTAIGEPTQDKTFGVNMVGSQPELYWTNEPGFTGDGARPDGAEWSTEPTNFEFRILYKDEDGDAPVNRHLCIDKDRDGSFDQDERFEMNPLGSNYQEGVIYRYTPLPLNSEINSPIKYKFDFDDGKNKGVGEPSIATYLSSHPIGETAICLNNYDQLFPSITFTDEDYKVFWEDHGEIDGGISHIWMELLSVDGQVKDGPGEPGQMMIDTGNKGAFKPLAQFDPESWKTLVIWEDLRNGSTRTPSEGDENIFKPETIYEGLDIYGIFIDADGKPLIDTSNSNASGEFIIGGSDSPLNMLNPDMAVGMNGQYLTVWESEEALSFSTRTEIFARFVRYPEGAYGERIWIPINVEGRFTGDGHQLMPRVAWNGEYYLVVWQDIADADLNSGYYHSRIYGIRIDPNGQLHPASPENVFKFFNDSDIQALADPNINQLFPDVASDGENFLVVWQDSRNLGKKRGYDIYGMRININGLAIQYLDPLHWEIPICTANEHQIKPRAFWDPQGEQFLIMWLEVPNKYDLSPGDMFSHASPSPGNIKFVRMNKNGKLLDSKTSAYPGISPVAISSTQNLFDLHCDQAKGCRMIWEDFRSNPSYDIYSAELESILHWADDPNFIYGINPLAAFESNQFTFKIEYWRWDSNASPKVSQVWIDLNDNGSFGEDEKFDMDLLSESPMIYTFKKEINSPENVSNDDFMSYRFYFEDQNNMVASGIGSNLNYFLVVPRPENNALLEWVGSEGFETDGVDPDQAYEGTKFKFSVSYRDPLNNPPTVPQVWIDQDDNGKYDDFEMFGMVIEGDPNDMVFSDDRIYTLEMNLFYPYQGDGNITYRFFFTYQPLTPPIYKSYFPDLGTIKVEGEPTSDHPISLEGALLEWVGNRGFESDGVDPDQAYTGTNFKFSVSYKDLSNNPPTNTQIWIDTNDNGGYEENEKFNMDEKDPTDNNFTNGKVYSFEKALFLEENEDITYRFVFTYDPFNDPNSPYAIYVKGKPAINKTVLVFYDRQIMDLNKGWSMISLPCEPPSFVSSAIFPNATVIYGFNRGVGYKRVPENEALQIGNGYWILLDQNQNYGVITEKVITEYTSPVENGWYMIGSCSYDAKASVSKGNIAVIYSFVLGMGYKRVLDTENIKPGKGYWILFEGIPNNEVAELLVEII